MEALKKEKRYLGWFRVIQTGLLLKYIRFRLEWNMYDTLSKGITNNNSTRYIIPYLLFTNLICTGMKYEHSCPGYVRHWRYVRR